MRATAINAEIQRILGRHERVQRLVETADEAYQARFLPPETVRR